MLYSPETGVAFLHIHKTAGVSMIHALRKVLPDLAHLPELPDAHYRISELFRALDARGEDPLNAKVMTIICHPMAHAVSIYEYWRSDRIPRKDRRLQPVALTRHLSFVDFLEQVLYEDQFAQHLLLNGIVPPNVTILRRETLASDAQLFLTRVTGQQIELDLPVLNRSMHQPVRTYMNADTIDRIAKSYAWTFSMQFYDPNILADETARDVASEHDRPSKRERRIPRALRRLSRVR